MLNSAYFLLFNSKKEVIANSYPRLIKLYLVQKWIHTSMYIIKAMLALLTVDQKLSLEEEKKTSSKFIMMLQKCCQF